MHLMDVEFEPSLRNAMKTARLEVTWRTQQKVNKVFRNVGRHITVVTL
jgi:hypothetical protein